MKILRDGLRGKDITFNCPACDCLYSLSDYKDWNMCKKKIVDIKEDTFVYEYTSICPQCNYEVFRTCNFNNLESRNRFYNSIHADIIFNRDDFKERYEYHE